MLVDRDFSIRVSSQLSLAMCAPFFWAICLAAVGPSLTQILNPKS